MKRVAIYTRVSTDEQTTENQLRELKQVAERNKWEIVLILSDDGVSGTKPLFSRKAGKLLKEAIIRKEIDMVCSWSVDRLGRSLQDLISTLNEMESKQVDLYLHLQNIDTTTPSGRAMFQMLGVFAEFERSMIRDRVVSGLARAKSKGKVLGRPTISQQKQELILHLKAKGKGIRYIAKELKTGVGTVIRILNEQNATQIQIGS